MLAIMSKQPGGLDCHLATQTPVLFGSVSTFPVSCQVVLFTRRSGGIVLSYKKQPVATLLR